jgi:cytochrome c2
MSLFKKPDLENKVTTKAVVSKTDLKAKLGKTLFVNHCASCHAKHMKTKLTEPALSSVQNRWQDDSELYNWIAKGEVQGDKIAYIKDLKKA